MKVIKYLIFTFICVAALALASCEDDFRPDLGGIVPGEPTQATITVRFEPEEDVSLDSRAMTEADGDAIQDINSFWMLLYDTQGLLVKKIHVKEGESLGVDPDVRNVSYRRNDNRVDGEEDFGDDSAGYLTFDVTLTQGRYYVYGVANVPEIASLPIGSTRSQLKQMPRKWSVTLAENSEMFGIFSIGSSRQVTDAEPVPVRADGAQLHCWLRRLASKVTVAFDGTKLYDNVQVYIDTIMLCDIPKQCYLGENNYPGRSLDDLETWAPSDRRYDIPNGVTKQGPIYEIQKLTDAKVQTLDPLGYYHVCKDTHPYLGKGEEIADNPDIITNKHQHTAKSLFFYENLQGTGKSKKQSQNGVDIDFPKPEENDLTSGWKDHKPYGTYVEVQGFYRYVNPLGNISSGRIKYRFMLGQDTESDYNAFRNTHYKLTLVLQGYANNYDWHIDYTEKTGIYLISPQYISYLYNKSMYATVKIVGEMDETYGLKAEIVSDTEKLDASERTYWRPWGEKGNEQYPDPNAARLPEYPTYPIYMNGSAPLLKPVAEVDGPGSGFLSLKKTRVLKIEHPDYAGDNSSKIPVTTALEYMNQYFIEEGLGNRDYSAKENDPTMEDEKNGRYSMQASSVDGGTIKERLYRVPFYTRAKELVTRTGMMGNNPFVSYPRKQKVKFSTKLKGEDGKFHLHEVMMDVIQVRRLENPKGIWRSGKSFPEDFHVTLLRMPEDNGSKFVPFRSVGKWSAEIVKGSAPIISMTSTPEGSGSYALDQKKVSRIEGDSECPIDFWVNFTGAKGCAVIRVRYHNYTCEHDIFVRVGYDPITISDKSSIRWSAFNVDHFDGYKAVPTNSPLQEGSLFRRGSRVAILSTNNPERGYTSAPPTKLNVIRPGKPATVTTASWAECLPNEAEKTEDTNNKYTLTKTWKISNSKERIATIDDFYTITTTEAKSLDFNIKKAYGVLYGDGATITAEDAITAYCYNNTDGSDSNRGMRGVFVYNGDNFNQIFLPLGKSGHGRRKGMGGWSAKPVAPYQNDSPGAMRYAARSYPYHDDFYGKDKAYPTVKYQPLFFDIYRRPGAQYWCRDYQDIPAAAVKQPDGTMKHPIQYSSSFDINYFTMGFEGYLNGSMNNANGSDSDALFLRTVHY